MKAIGYHVPSAIDRTDALIDIETAKPVPDPRDLLVRIHAVSVNPIDTQVRARAPRAASEPNILSWDAAGVVEAVGNEVTLFAPGGRGLPRRRHQPPGHQR